MVLYSTSWCHQPLQCQAGLIENSSGVFYDSLEAIILRLTAGGPVPLTKGLLMPGMDTKNGMGE